MFIILLILDSIPEFDSFYPSTAWSITILFGAGAGFFIFLFSLRFYRVKKRVRPLIKFSSLMLSSFFIYEIHRWIRVPIRYTIYTELSIQLFFYVLIVIVVTFSFSYLLDYVRYMNDGILKNTVDKLIDFREASCFIFSFVFSYFTFGRDIFASVYPLPFHVDWLFISLISLVLGVGYYQYLNENTTEPGFPTEEEEKDIYSSKVGKLIKLQDDFIVHSQKDGIIFYLMDMLIRESKTMSEKEALDILKPLIVYDDEPLPFYLIGLWMTRALKKRKESRRSILNNIMKEIEDEIERNEIKIV